MAAEDAVLNKVPYLKFQAKMVVKNLVIIVAPFPPLPSAYKCSLFSGHLLQREKKTKKEVTMMAIHGYESRWSEGRFEPNKTTTKNAWASLNTILLFIFFLFFSELTF